MILHKTVIIFRGDTIISPAVGLTTGSGKIMLDELEKPVKIGSIVDVRGENLPHPVELIFEKKESVDALIKQLKVVKKDMIKFEKGELKDEQSKQEDK